MAGINKRETEKSLLRIETSIPSRHMFEDGSASSGIALMIGQHAGPLASPLMIPPNMRAVVTFNEREHALLKDCTGEVSALETSTKNYENCIASNVMNETTRTCNCTLLASGTHPRNEYLCTPKLLRECVRPNVLDAIFDIKVRI